MARTSKEIGAEALEAGEKFLKEQLIKHPASTKGNEAATKYSYALGAASAEAAEAERKIDKLREEVETLKADLRAAEEDVDEAYEYANRPLA